MQADDIEGQVETNRAIDLGYGWTKVSVSPDAVKSFQSLPWRNPKVVHGAAAAKVMTVRAAVGQVKADVTK